MNTLYRPLLVFCLLGLSTLSFAQSLPLVRFGVKGGIQQRSLDIGTAFKAEPMGIHGGLYLRIAPPITMGGQIELLYMEKNKPVQNGDEVQNVRLNYMEIPVFAVFPFGPLDIQLGGYGSKLLSTDIGGLAQQVTDQGVQLSADGFKDNDYGLLAGLALNLGRWQAGARYTYGIGSVDDSGHFSTVDGKNNRAAQFYLGYALIK